MGLCYGILLNVRWKSTKIFFSNENLMLKKTFATNVSVYKGETSSKKEIQIIVDPPPMNNMQTMPKQ